MARRVACRPACSEKSACTTSPATPCRTTAWLKAASRIGTWPKSDSPAIRASRRCPSPARCRTAASMAVTSSVQTVVKPPVIDGSPTKTAGNRDRRSASIRGSVDPDVDDDHTVHPALGRPLRIERQLLRPGWRRPAATTRTAGWTARSPDRRRTPCRTVRCPASGRRGPGSARRCRCATPTAVARCGSGPSRGRARRRGSGPGSSPRPLAARSARTRPHPWRPRTGARSR